ncbi:MAG: DUF4132 domain-containing protein [Cyanobacteriota bacterium]|nr:DUF4132 domain-containing protein [Cyanobacteriota bacterium]
MNNGLDSTTQSVDPEALPWVAAILREETLNFLQKKSATETEIRELDPSRQVWLALNFLRWYLLDTDGTYRHNCWQVSEVMFQLWLRDLPFGADDVLFILKALQSNEYLLFAGDKRLLALVRFHLQHHPPTPELQTEVETLCRRLEWGNTAHRQLADKLRSLFPKPEGALPLVEGDAWSDGAFAFLQEQPPEILDPWRDLLEHCAGATGSKPGAKWLKQARELRGRLGADVFVQTLLLWLPWVDLPRTRPLPDWRAGADVMTDKNADILRGLVWLCGDLEGRDLVEALGKLTLSTYRKVAQLGPRAPKVGNAALWALSQMPTLAAAAQLSILKTRVKGSAAQKAIVKALQSSAERAGLSPSDLEELAAPTYGLTAVGLRRETWGDFQVELRVEGGRRGELAWFRADGKPQKSVPKAVKTEFAEELKALKQDQKSLQAMLSAQSARLESFYLQPKTWDFSVWESRYLNHPLLGCLTRRLLWTLERGENSAVVLWQEGELRDRAGAEIPWLDDQTQVSLWHPITASTETVQAWRALLWEKHITQPFKQAYREIYLLAPAEETTRVYSNRFAAHILKQHPFNALCAQRGWRNQLRLMVDDDCPPATLTLENWGLRAEFWIEALGETYGADTNETGVFHYVATDQLRFYPLSAPSNYGHACGGGYYSAVNSAVSPLPLETIPALVFSEVLRDADLFVGVTSVGNDPNWFDGGPEGRHRDYWQSYSFGELSATAETRRQVLAALLPRLKKIRERCELQERFLRVRGDLRTYKIHLGSGNILMEPNDQYLCIVQAPGSRESIFLPFEGDQTLTVILSKAFLLAADSEITDPSITRQIQVH